VYTAFLVGCATSTTAGKGHASSSIAPRIYEAEYNEVFNKAVEAVTKQKWQVTFTDQSTGIISAATPTNLWIWGDNVSIQVKQVDENKVRIDVSSGTPSQLIDWGRNSRNIANYLRTLDSLMSVSKQEKR